MQSMYEKHKMDNKTKRQNKNKTKQKNSYNLKKALKLKTKPKREKKDREKGYPINTLHFSKFFFTCSFFFFFVKISWAQSIYVIETMLSVTCHFAVKAFVFFELFKAISLSILLVFRIPAMRLFIFIYLFSLDLWTYNLNLSRMWLTNT